MFFCGREQLKQSQNQLFINIMKFEDKVTGKFFKNSQKQ